MRCFVIMPYGNLSGNPERKRDLDLLYGELIKPAVESVALPGKPGAFVKCHRADKEPRPGEIVMHIVENLVLSEISIADVTGRNPNVFYELGVRHAVNDNTILLAQSEEDIPVDLRGQRYIIYQRDFQGGVRLRNEIVSAVAEIVRSPSKIDNPVRRYLYDQERQKIEARGRPPGYDFVRELLQEVSSLRRDFKSQLDEVRGVLSAVTSQQGPSPYGKSSAHELDFLAGAWMATPSGTHLYARLVNGEIVAPYCFGGDSAMTGHFHNFRKHGENVFARFEWCGCPEIRGYGVWKIESNDRLSGGWWAADDVPQDIAQDVLRLPQRTQGMNAWTLTRLHGKATPRWALEYPSSH